jgi:hypothetical protein
MSQNPPPQSDFPLTLAEVLSAELREQRLPVETDPVDKEVQAALAHASTWTEKKKASEDIVPKIYAAIHGLKQKRSALCLSGGGVRSATFNLGVLQGLARCGLLDRFDYLSTVSGGGFIGSWLTAWIKRAGGDVNSVVAPLSAPPQNPLDPEPKPLYNLRVYANYLTPKKGLLSPDTWTLIAIYVRNLFLNWLVFLPAIMTFLMLPRLWTGIVNLALRSAPHHSSWALALGVLGLVSGLVSLTCIIVNLPSIFDKNWRTSVILLSCVLPLVLMAAGLSLYWVMVRDHPQTADGWLSSLSALIQGERPSWHIFVAAGALIPAFPQLVVSLRYRAPILVKLLLVPLVGAGGALTGVLTYAVLNLQPGLLLRLADAVRFGSVQLNANLLYVSLSVPFLLVIFMIGGTFVAGFSSRFSGPEDQEWWARSGAWLLIAVMTWAAMSLLVTVGPLLLVDLRALFGNGSLGSIKSKLTAIVGIVSGVISIFGGFSSRTKSSGAAEGTDSKGKVLGIVTSVAAAIFALYIAVVLVWATDWALFGLAKALQTARLTLSSFASAQTPQAVGHATGVHVSRLPASPGNGHQYFVTHSPWWFQALATLVLFIATFVLGRLINTNRFSLHYYWRNRMMRAYLGATRPDEEREQTRSQFTDFDDQDNLHMADLIQKPLHVVNVTLNLAGGGKLEWQDRKAESFTISPLHCGSYWLGYRKSEEYAMNSKGKGISLATAVAISGAAASPNMGYMMTSPVLRIIMTLFNVRLGFWLGNPGPDGSDTYQSDSPRESVRPIVEEALGQTDDKNPYVYLSDGGHFENFGLYEMILRRCRFIVVSDASTDTEYAYDSLAVAIRQIRVDFGVPIDMGEMQFGNQPDAGNNYCAVGVIKYSCVDKPSGSTADDAKYDGVLVYLKPSLIGDEPRDVLNYHATSKTFPQESIADQWFSEPQFESYRALGSHMVEQICTVCSGTKLKASGEPDPALPGGGAKTSAAEPDLKGRVEAIMAELRKPSPSEDDSAACNAFADFVANAGKHVGRHREPAPKDA